MDTEPKGGSGMIGRYKLLKEIGRGGMGRVFKAVTPTGKVVAIKTLAPHLIDQQVERARFHREADIAINLDHPNLVRAIEVGEADGQFYFVMEYVAGASLARRIKRHGKFVETEAVRIIVAVARALHKAHQLGLVHRDVKPANILLGNDGTVKLADLGLAKKLDEDLDLTQPDKGLGTPLFMAPEQLRDAKHADVRCDIYSLGQTLYTLVTGEYPFRGAGVVETFLRKTNGTFTPAEQITPELGADTARTIALAMSSSPDERPQSAREFVDILLGRTRESTPPDQPPVPKTAVDTGVIFTAQVGPPGDAVPSVRANAPKPVVREPAARPVTPAIPQRSPCLAVREEFDRIDFIQFDQRALIQLAVVAGVGALLLLVLLKLFF